MNIIGIIPARISGSRFPGKPLALINNIPMIGHVYFRSTMCRTLRDVYVATCDQKIMEYIESIGGKAVMTKSTHNSAADRVGEAILTIEKSIGKIDIAVMIQGDEPMVIPDMIDDVLKPMIEDPAIRVVNIYGSLNTEEFDDPNEVKVVIDKQGFALYFSREAIPSTKFYKVSDPLKGANIPMPAAYFKQVCIIPFRRDFLIKFNQLAPTPLEMIESIDMLRVLENGYKVKMVYTKYQTKSVNIREDIKKVEGLMKNDPLINYSKKGYQ